MTALETVLAEKYGLSGVTLTPAPRGFIAETYRVQADSGIYFAKLIPSRYAANVESSLPVLAALRSAGIHRINTPVPALDGSLSSVFEDNLLALFNYIDGVSTFEYDFERYVALIAQIHAVTSAVHVKVKQADFQVSVQDDLFSKLQLLWSRGFSNPHQAELQALMLQYRAELLGDFARLEALAAQLQRQEFERVITHGDAPGNILKTIDGDLYLIDWDDVLLAPPERDTWFHLDDLSGGSHHADRQGFLTRYRQTFPDYQVNWQAYDYYLLTRYFEDLEGFIVNVMNDQLSDEQKGWNVSQLRKDCLGWLRPLVRGRYP
jgi:Ser/Thr protein kinase RdoA (MazF antagonist)